MTLREEIKQKWDFGDFDSDDEIIDMVFTTLKERIEAERKKRDMTYAENATIENVGFHECLDTITRLLE